MPMADVFVRAGTLEKSVIVNVIQLDLRPLTVMTLAHALVKLATLGKNVTNVKMDTTRIIIILEHVKVVIVTCNLINIILKNGQIV